MPRWFKLWTLALCLWAWWAVERIEERHALIPQEERVLANVGTLKKGGETR